MPDFDVLEPAIDPANRMCFLLDWEVTMKCNLDCSYCASGFDGGHDNTTKHPALADCLNSIDFMFQYVDLYMNTKVKGLRYVVLNVYGGESLYHPNIVEILEQCRERYIPYKDKWNLTVTTTTNAIVNDKKLQSIMPYIDEFTCSYHTEASEKQKAQFKKNLLTIRDSGKGIKCIILMHTDPDLFADAQSMIDWCQANGIRYLPRQLDHRVVRTEFNYDVKQVKWFNSMYQKKTYNTDVNVGFKQIDDKIDLADSGRACCGGRQTCKDQNYRQRNFFVENKFPDWHCSVNEFFVFVKQLSGDIYVNKDCKMNFDGEIAPIGNISNYGELLEFTKHNLQNNTMPIIRCKKYKCLCGLCAPKAKDLSTFNQIMEKYRI